MWGASSKDVGRGGTRSLHARGQGLALRGTGSGRPCAGPAHSPKFGRAECCRGSSTVTLAHQG